MMRSKKIGIKKIKFKAFEERKQATCKVPHIALNLGDSNFYHQEPEEFYSLNSFLKYKDQTTRRQIQKFNVSKSHSPTINLTTTTAPSISQKSKITPSLPYKIKLYHHFWRQTYLAKINIKIKAQDTVADTKTRDPRLIITGMAH